jgi:peptidoglycan hydrolase-like protein with peptidoglycan-binding domain
MWPLILIGAAGVGLAWYEHHKKSKSKLPVLQSLRATTPAGKPVQVVVPVAAQPPPVAGVSVTPLHPQNTGTGASYAPAPVVVQSSPGVLNLAPTVITSTGAATLSVTTPQDVQNALNTLGYASPLLVVDGKLGPKSQAAVKAFQTKAGLTVDGVAGPQTKGALQSALATLAGPNSAVGDAANTMAGSTPSPGFGVEVAFGRHRRRRKHKNQQPQDGGGGDTGDGGGDDGGGDAPAPAAPAAPTAASDDDADAGFGGKGRRRHHHGDAGAEEDGLPSLVVHVRTLKEVQHALNLLGASPPLAETGTTTPETLAAVKAFQIVHGLVADGIAGRKTKWALCIALNPGVVDEELDADAGAELGQREPVQAGNRVGFG